MNTPTGSLYVLHYNLAIWIKRTSLFEGSSLHNLFLENNIEQIEIMLGTILMLFHYHIYHRSPKEIRSDEVQKKNGNSLVWCEEIQAYAYNLEPLPPQYVIVR